MSQSHGQQHSPVLPGQAGESCPLHSSHSEQPSCTPSLFLVFGLFTKRDPVQCSKFSLNSWFVKLLHKVGSDLCRTFLEGWLPPARCSGVVMSYLVSTTPILCFPEGDERFSHRLRRKRVRCKKLVYNNNLCYSAQYCLEIDLCSNIVGLKIHAWLECVISQGCSKKCGLGADLISASLMRVQNL